MNYSRYIITFNSYYLGMEELLNKLIKKWWKPFNVNCAWTNVEVINRLRDNQYLPEHTKIIFKTENHWHVFDCNIRALVSKSSWLWQFVCENGMRPKRVWYDEHYWQRDNHTNWRWMVMESDPEYRIIESALKDEEDLERFLLDNIKVWWTI